MTLYFKIIISIIITTLLVPYSLHAVKVIDNTAVVSIQCNVRNRTELVLVVPSFNNDGNFTVSWNYLSSATIYQLQEDTFSTFNSSNLREFWPAGDYENITNRSAGTYYFRIRGWTKPPEEGGIASDWSKVAQVIVSP